jgi:CMP-N,N'-diacetyllegionaminic acid synthase
MRVLGVIPARKGSKSIKGKNVVPLCGKPLISYTLEAAKESRLDYITVTTDCPVVRMLAKDYGISVIDRPERLCMDDTPMIPVLQHAVIECGGGFDAVMLLQPTCPMRRAQDIDEAIAKMEHEKATSVISYVDVGPNHPSRMVLLLKNGFPYPVWDNDDRFANKQDLPSVYLRSGDIYLTQIECLVKGDWLGHVPRVYVIDPARHCNVDSARDLAWAEFLMQREANQRKHESQVQAAGENMAEIFKSMGDGYDASKRQHLVYDGSKRPKWIELKS